MKISDELKSIIKEAGFEITGNKIYEKGKTESLKPQTEKTVITYNGANNKSISIYEDGAVAINIGKSSIRYEKTENEKERRIVITINNTIDLFFIKTNQYYDIYAFNKEEQYLHIAKDNDGIFKNKNDKEYEEMFESSTPYLTPIFEELKTWIKNATNEDLEKEINIIKHAIELLIEDFITYEIGTYTFEPKKKKRKKRELVSNN